MSNTLPFATSSAEEIFAETIVDNFKKNGGRLDSRSIWADLSPLLPKPELVITSISIGPKAGQLTITAKSVD